MLFNSINFLIFFPVVTAVYFLLPYRYRVLWLLAASCYFYMAFIPVFVLILAFTITVDYFAGIAIAGAEGKKRKQFLMASIIANVGVLFIFKYFNFFNANIAALADFLHWNYSLEALSLVLPIGLSFHVFQSLSYTIEVYRGNQKPERNFLILAIYVMFYPQLVAGPIERPQNLLHQFREKHQVDLARIGKGLRLMVYGFFMKLFIADNLAPFVDQVYDHPLEYLAPSFVIATVFFAFQIYCDFAGYSYIAIGSARVMGFTLMENFRQPYFSRSVSEFWRRWHISLSTWFKDYVYVPLGGSRKGERRHITNLLVTFLLSGLWHGANWTYVVWGGLNGIYLVLETFKNKYLKVGLPRISKNLFAESLKAIAQTLLTFALICLTWVFFRAESIGGAFHIIGQMFAGWDMLPEGMSRAEFYRQYVFIGRSDYDFYWSLGGIALLLVAEYLYLQNYVSRIFTLENRFVRYGIQWFLIATALLLIIVFAKTDAQQFIYFQF